MFKDLYGTLVSASSGWDQLNEFNLQMYNAILAKDIGRFKAGEQVDCIAFEFVGTDTPVIQIYMGDMVFEYPVEFDVKIGAEKECPKPV